MRQPLSKGALGARSSCEQQQGEEKGKREDHGRQPACCAPTYTLESVLVSGADHLYIKQQILAWLERQGIRAAARLSEDAERLGSEVVFEPGGRGCLRVVLGQVGGV
ncbi:hypothetical protein ABZ819_34310 [Streptomyces venezuelae]|uniref:hypothetical protein n=1 Tax=Streptomyces venezuelae TaxID=54571 RepID=UPI0034184334